MGLALLIAAGLAWGGCAPAAPAARLVQSQTSGRSTATLTVEPHPPRSMQEVRLSLRLQGAEGKPVPGARVCFDLTMPGCPAMPTNRPEAAEAGQGVYQATALFTMAGYWRVQAQVSGADVSQAFTFYLKTR